VNIIDIIRKKRDGGKLSEDEIAFWLNGYIGGSVKDYQSAALLMALFIRGLDEQETFSLVKQMLDSGSVMDYSDLDGIFVDKHSTGGVGDKTTLIVAPIAAAAGLKVSKLSGRGLGHTGGTIDKLESIPGFNCNLNMEQFRIQVDQIGLAVNSAGKELVPADKLLYALRDVTATVDSIPLIAASIMSKKIAGGADIIVLDVKYGSGAFMKTLDDARRLAQLMVKIGLQAGKKVSALISAMEQPLGYAIGNSLEVKEALAVLQGFGPQDLRELAISLAAEMIYLAGKTDNRGDAQKRTASLLDCGAAYQKFMEMVKAQGGDLSATPSFEDAPLVVSYTATSDGFITKLDAEIIGKSTILLKSGRVTKEDAIDHSTGIVLRKKLGEKVISGEEIADIYCQNQQQAAAVAEMLINAVVVENQPQTLLPLIVEIVC